MRISTSNFYDTAIGRISDLQSGMAKTQNQISTGRRILTPSDDPVGASRALEISQTKAVNERFSVNRQNAKDSLNQVDSTLGGVTSLLEDAKASVIQAGNGALSDADRASIAIELSSRLEDLVTLANARDGTGNYLFSGYQTSTEPFTRTAAGATYNGDQGERVLQVDGTRQVAVSDTGQTVFQSGTPQDIFKTMTDLVALLQTPGTAGLAAGLAAAHGNIDASLNNVLTVRASVGSRLKELDSLDTLGSEVDVQYQASLENLEGLDYAKAISDLVQQKSILEASQQSFVKVSGLSLFNFLT